MPYYEIVADSFPIRSLIKADTFADAIKVLIDEGVEEEYICSITRIRYNKVIT